MNDSILFNSDGEATAQAVTAALTRRGYRVIRTFDLRSVLAAPADRDASQWNCDCPYHGTDRCTCQFVVLLVYGDTAEPAVITTHSRDTQARLRIVYDALTRPDPGLAGQIMTVLRETAQAQPVTASPLGETKP